MGRCKNIDISKIWEKLTTTLRNNFESFKTSEKEVTTDVVEITENKTELLRSQGKTSADEELLLGYEKKKKWFLQMESILVKVLRRLLK